MVGTGLHDDFSCCGFDGNIAMLMMREERLCIAMETARKLISRGAEGEEQAKEVRLL